MIVIESASEPLDACFHAGLRWDDPDIGIVWPEIVQSGAGQPTLSGKDATVPALRDFVTPFKSAR